VLYKKNESHSKTPQGVPSLIIVLLNAYNGVSIR
jgi:hypothetical protein